jgi:ribosomal protein S18 acetylase RimI-like enzyme
MFETRAARDGDDLRPLWDTAFLPDEVFFTRDYRPERALIVTDGTKPVSMLHMLSRTLLLGEETLRAGYIMGVATDPAYRRQGLAGRLIAAAVQTIEEQGFDCAMLIPASAELASFYQRFGLTLRGRMPRFADSTPPDTRPAGLDDIEKLSALYNAAFPYRVERDAFEWETILLEYAVMIGEDGYMVGDERGILEAIPAPSSASDSGRAACIKPYSPRIQNLLDNNRPYINLLYT